MRHLLVRISLILVASAIPCFTGCSQADDQAIARGPYLQNATTNSIILRFSTAQAIQTTLRYHTLGAGSVINEPAPATEHLFKIKALLPDTKYYYQIKSDSKVLSQSHFRTAPTRGTATRLHFAALGDSGTGGSHQLAIANQIAQWHPRFLLHVGDIVYEKGADADYKQKFFTPYQAILPSTPFFPAIGNHDAFNINDYLAIFSLPALASGSQTERYYSFDYGFVHFTVLDSKQPYGPGSTQYTWLINDLAKVKDRPRIWRVVFFHHPPFSLGKHGSTVAMQTDLIPALEAGNVDLVLSGHDHTYERTGLVSLGESSNHKILYVVTGGGGNSLYEAVKEDPHVEIYRPVYHFLGLIATRRSIRYRAIGENGETVDRVTLFRGKPNHL